MKIKEVIVVEGKDDTAKIQQVLEADTIETNGSAINQEILKQIQHAQQKRGVIIFTDPDYPGERIRHIIDQSVPGCKHAFLSQSEARSKRMRDKSLGIEHASKEAIHRSLSAVYELMDQNVSEIDKDDLIANGLIGGKGSRFKRERLGEYLNIGYTNGKQLLNRLTMFQITKAQFEEAIQKVQQEAEKHD